jgi:hypothetical protein
MATSTQSVQFSNIAATTSGFMLKGGRLFNHHHRQDHDCPVADVEC